MIDVQEIISFIKANNNQSKKEWWERYMRDSIEFLGVPIPELRKDLKKRLKNRSDDEIILIADELMKQKIAEYKLYAILLYQEYLLNSLNHHEIIAKIDKYFELGYIYDWNTCDWLCVRVLTPIVESENYKLIEEIISWSQSKNYWQARASLVAFAQADNLNSKYTILESALIHLIKRDERFAKTSVGWVLREISKFDLDFVIKMIHNYYKYFTTEVINNSLKYQGKSEKKKIISEIKD